MLIYNIIAKTSKCWVIREALDDTWGIADVTHIADSGGGGDEPHSSHWMTLEA